MLYIGNTFIINVTPYRRSSMKRFLLPVLMVILVMSAHPCFDTYLFLNKMSLAYPKGMLVAEGLGEYSVNNFSKPENDAMFMGGNLYYGITERFSIQVGVETNEAVRNKMGFGAFGIRGVYNLIRTNGNAYTLDATLQHMSDMGSTLSYEASFPNVFNHGSNTFVMHPVMNLEKHGGYSFTLGGHCGVFHSFGQTAIIGLGTEYMSAQAASRFGNRLVEGEAAASLFLGAQIGEWLYWQNEFAKGLANSRDFGFATTFKILISR